MLSEEDIVVQEISDSSRENFVMRDIDEFLSAEDQPSVPVEEEVRSAIYSDSSGRVSQEGSKYSQPGVRVDDYKPPLPGSARQLDHESEVRDDTMSADVKSEFSVSMVEISNVFSENTENSNRLINQS